MIMPRRALSTVLRTTENTGSEADMDGSISPYFLNEHMYMAQNNFNGTI